MRSTLNTLNTLTTADAGVRAAQYGANDAHATEEAIAWSLVTNGALGGFLAGNPGLKTAPRF